MHDIGNIINRENHAQSGASMTFNILHRLGMSPAEIIQVVSAIGHHDESCAAPISPIAAALIIADKSDVRRTRVRNLAQHKKEDMSKAADIHDRVNYAVQKSELRFNIPENKIILRIIIDTSMCPVMDYFSIFLNRMILCRDSAVFFNKSFELMINNSRLL